MSISKEKNVLITGVSSGIGHALAGCYLENGWSVFGMSRRTPDDHCRHASFHFSEIDLAEFAPVHAKLLALVNGVPKFDLVILNAGVLGKFGDLGDAQFDDLKQTMNINVWANKVVLDTLFNANIAIDQVVAISSGAAVNGNRGWSGYAISKAALNMFTMLYARERPDSHFCALAPGLVDTEIQDELQKVTVDERFPSLVKIDAMRGTEDFPTAQAVAPRLATAIERLPTLVESGAFADVRKPPLS